METAKETVLDLVVANGDTSAKDVVSMVRLQQKVRQLSKGGRRYQPQRLRISIRWRYNEAVASHRSYAG